MVALFLDDNKTKDDGDGKENGKEIKCLYQQTTTLHLHHAILYISLPSLHHYDMKLPNFASPLYGIDKTQRKITLDMVPKKISPRFAKLNETE